MAGVGMLLLLLLAVIFNSPCSVMGFRDVKWQSVTAFEHVNYEGSLWSWAMPRRWENYCFNYSDETNVKPDQISSLKIIEIECLRVWSEYGCKGKSMELGEGEYPNLSKFKKYTGGPSTNTKWDWNDKIVSYGACAKANIIKTSNQIMRTSSNLN